MNDYIEKVIATVERRDNAKPEYIQCVKEVYRSLEKVIEQHPEYVEDNLLERMVEPDRLITFRIAWVDDAGKTQVNRGYRVQFNSAIGPYKGGLRFHPSVNSSIMYFLGFEQTFKNSLTGLPMGGAKGGSDFDPRGKSRGEVMRFCQAFMTELQRHIGSNVDVPAGDIGVGGREVGFLFGQYKRISDAFENGVITGKGISYGGSLIRPEATGYGNVYFLLNMLATKGIDIKDKVVAISGSGNVAQYTAEKLLQLGAKVVSMSDSDGTIYVPEGISQEQLNYIFKLKNEYRGRIREFAEEYGCQYFEGERPWKHCKCDIAMPSATQNEIDGDDARALLANGVIAVSEGANMPSTPEAIKEFLNARILYAPGKAANAGGVSVSGLEMAQNSQKLSWSAAEVDEKLKGIMKEIHHQCELFGKEADGYINYVKGANVAGFMKVARAMMAQGVL